MIKNCRKMTAVSTQIWKDHMDHVFLASDKFIREQPEKLQELINQLVRAAAFIEKILVKQPLWVRTVPARRQKSI